MRQPCFLKSYISRDSCQLSSEYGSLAFVDYKQMLLIVWIGDCYCLR